MEVVVLDDELVAPGELLRGGEPSQVAMFQHVLFGGGRIAAFAFAHAASVKK